jgi:carbamoyl-phosphate synthase large subunit
MNLLLSCVGKRGYIADFFRPHLRPGERIVGTSRTPWTPGFAACDVGVLMPPISSDEYLPAVVELCERYEVGGLLSFYDPDVMALSTATGRLRAAGVVPFIPDEGTARIGHDKWATFEALGAAGFDVPDTTIDLAEALVGLAAGRFRYPLVVKPRTGSGSADVFIAHTERQLVAFFEYAPGMLVQTHIDGEMYDIEALGDTSGRVLHVVAWRKFLSRQGETEQAVTVHDPELVETGRRLAELIGLVGPMDVDLFRTRDGRVVILELNLRFGGGYAVSHLAGADFPGLIMQVLRGDEPEPRIGCYQADVGLLKALHVLGGATGPFLSRLASGELVQLGNATGLSLSDGVDGPVVEQS